MCNTSTKLTIAPERCGIAATSLLVQADDYLLLCQRYIELNPVRANMVNDPAHYCWSSYRANGLGQTDPLLTPHEVYLSLGQSEVERMEAYRALFRSELDADAIGDIRVALDQGQPLGNSRFLDSIERATGQRREVKLRGRPRKQLADSKGTEDQLLIKI